MIYIETRLLCLILLVTSGIYLIISRIFIHKYLAQLEKHLESVELICIAKAGYGGGFIGTTLRLSVITQIIILPSLFYNRGHLQKNATENIPKYLKRWVIWLFIMLTTIVLSAITLAYFRL